MDNESKNSNLLSLCSTNQVGSACPKWLDENVEGINQSVKLMLKLIEVSSSEEAEIYYRKRPELIALVEEINHKHRLLAEQYGLLLEDLHGNVSLAMQMQNPGSTLWPACQDSFLLTPIKKLDVHKNECQDISFHFPLTSGGSSSNISAKEDVESSSLTSDSDTESYNSSPGKYLNLKPSNSGEMVKENFVDLETGVFGSEKKLCKKGKPANDLLMVKGNGQYVILLSRISEYEEEIARLKSELENYASVTIDTLENQLRLSKREDDLEVERRKVSELQMQVAMLETTIFDSSCEIGVLTKELQIAEEKLEDSEAELAKIKNDMASQISQSTFELQNQLELAQKDAALLKANLTSEETQSAELQQRITRYAADISDRDHKISKLTAALQVTLTESEIEKAQLQAYNSNLSQNLNLLKAEEMRWRGDMEGLKAQLNEKDALMESLNKTHDRLKLKYDMLMAEKDVLNAKLQALGAELCSRDDKIQQMEGQLRQLQMQHIEVSAVSENAFKLRDELRMEVEELKKEVQRQAATISDRAEEKREAIRQLCFSIEHYRSGYQVLRQAYIGQRRHALIGS